MHSTCFRPMCHDCAKLTLAASGVDASFPPPEEPGAAGADSVALPTVAYTSGIRDSGNHTDCVAGSWHWHAVILSEKSYYFQKPK